jgi:hypothetical protein
MSITSESEGKLGPVHVEVRLQGLSLTRSRSFLKV